MLVNNISVTNWHRYSK